MAGVAVGAAFLGAAVYGGVRLADSINDDLAAQPAAPSPSSSGLPAPYDTLNPSQYHYGPAVAHSPDRDVVAYKPRHHPHHVLTVPFTLTNHGSEPYEYDAIVTVTGATGSGMAQTAHISSNGLLPPNATMTTKANFEVSNDIPSGDIRVRITDVSKRDASGSQM